MIPSVPVSSASVRSQPPETPETNWCRTSWNRMKQKYPTVGRITSFSHVHSPFLAQLATLITCLGVLLICIIANSYDFKWNAELRRNNMAFYKYLSRTFHNASSNKSNKSMVKPELLFRERWEFVDSIIIQAYVIFAIFLHMINYWICREVNYRISFGRLLNFGLIVTYTASLLLTLHATIETNGSYYDLEDILNFRRCRFGNNERKGAGLLMLTGKQDSLLCQRYDFRFTAIGFGVFSICIMLGILLFARDESEDEGDGKGDLFDDNDDDSRIHLVLEEQKSDANTLSTTKTN